MAPVAFSIFANAPTVFDISNSPVILGPNITGGTQVQYPSKIRGFENFTGAFKSNKLNRGGDWSDYGQGGPMGFLFDASLVSEKYGASDSIQPQSAYTLIIIKA